MEESFSTHSLPVLHSYTLGNSEYIAAYAVVANALGQLPSMIVVGEVPTEAYLALRDRVGAQLVQEGARSVRRQIKVQETLYTLGDIWFYSEAQGHKIQQVSVTVFHRPSHREQAYELARELATAKRKRKPRRIGLIQQGAHGLSLAYHTLARTQVDVALHYGDDFAAKYTYLVEQLRLKDGGGLVVLHGPPGTGKTMLIRHLVGQVRGKRFIFIPAGMTEALASPQLLTFLTEYRNAILIIEEAEEVLRARTGFESNTAIANLLNLTDGLLKDVLHIQVICSFNYGHDRLDPALLRQGRLILKHEFGPLPPEQAARVAQAHGLPAPAPGPRTLAQIFHPESPDALEPASSLGFTARNTNGPN